MIKVLYAEGNPMNRKLAMLSQFKKIQELIDLQIAINTEDAEILLNQTNFDLVILQLTNIEGYKIIQNIRLGLYKISIDVPVIACSTCRSESITALECLEMGFNAFVPIPIIGKKLRDAVIKLLHLQKASL